MKMYASASAMDMTSWATQHPNSDAVHPSIPVAVPANHAVRSCEGS